MRSTFLVLTGLLLLVPGAVLAVGPLDLSAEVGCYGHYLWRGMTLTDGTVVQPEVSAEVAGFGLSLWGNLNADDPSGDSSLNEIDVTVSYGLGLPVASLDLGVVYYSLPDASEQNTAEAFASASANLLLSPTLSVYRDVDLVEGWYWEAGLSHGVVLSPGASLDLSARAGLGSERYMAGYFPLASAKALGDEATTSSLTDYSITAALPWHPAPMATITPSLSWCSLLNDASDVVDAGGGDTGTLVWGVSASVGF